MAGDMALPVVILAGGKGTRLGDLTRDTPKSLIEVAGKPFIVHQIEALWRRGYTDFTVCLGHHWEKFLEADAVPESVKFLNDGDTPAGTGGALRRAADLIGGPFLWMYGDAYLPTDYRKIEAEFLASCKPALMTVYENSGRWDRSNVEVEDGKIRHYDKVAPTLFARHIDYGMGGLTPRAFNDCPPGIPLDLAVVFQSLLERGLLASYEVKERFYEIGSLDGLLETRMYLEGK